MRHAWVVLLVACGGRSGGEVDSSAQAHHGEPHGLAFAENECSHWNLGMTGGDLQLLVAECIEAFYSEGPGGGHYENMLGSYGSLGCGLFQDGQSVTIIQDFGR